MTTFEEFYEDTTDSVTSYLLRRWDVAIRRGELAEALSPLSEIDREALLLMAWDGLSSRPSVQAATAALLCVGSLGMDLTPALLVVI